MNEETEIEITDGGTNTYLDGRGLQASSSLRRRSSEREMNKRISSDIERCNVVAVAVARVYDGWKKSRFERVSGAVNGEFNES